MALSHFQALIELNVETTVVGRSPASVLAFEELTKHKAVSGGLSAFLKSDDLCFDAAIVASSHDQLFYNVVDLLNKFDIPVLVEKPVALNPEQLFELQRHPNSTNIKIAYNRRFYPSVRQIRSETQNDRLLSCFLDLSEVSSRVNFDNKTSNVLDRWAYSNAAHVLDTFVFLCGWPVTLNREVSEKLDWHVASAIHVGSGMTDKGILYSYHSNWLGPGRWNLEFVSTSKKYVLKPMEELRVVEHGSFIENPLSALNFQSESGKPGVLAQMRSFLFYDSDDFADINYQVKLHALIDRIFGYED